MLLFAKASAQAALRGGPNYYRWMGFLAFWILCGVAAYMFQFQHGLDVTDMSDQIPWGAYIANFTYLVGLAAAGVMLVIPAYVYNDHAMHEVTILAELLAIAVLISCLLFVTVDIGRPDRAWHLIPMLGRLNFPVSMLAWDVVVVSGYLVINLYVATYLLFNKFIGRKPTKAFYWPVVIIGMVWAIGIHTVTAFLYSSLGGRPAWHSAVLAPRFLASAFASGPCLMIIVLMIVRDYMRFPIRESVFLRLRQIVAVMTLINLFFLFTEIFTELYPATLSAASMDNLLFGLRGHRMFVPYIWASIILDVGGTLVLVIRPFYTRRWVLAFGCGMVVVGVWIGKGMGLIIPGFVPSALGEVMDYSPSLIEFLVSMGVWSTGAAIFTVFVKIAVPIEIGELRLTPLTPVTEVPQEST
ncbi:MAG: NrfD/PsrC family molybdoenzyme membrane anchor subunit [Deltaproteobacteria bacterium]